MNAVSTLVHGTCVALGESAAILVGASGSGKSDLALRFVLGTPAELEPALISDDQIRVTVSDGRLIASAPETIAGRIEVRGIGIVPLVARTSAEVKLIIRLVEPDAVPRMPPAQAQTQKLCGIDLPVMLLTPFEASAHLKVRLAIQGSVA
jgi:serine kinase of HPr protein (carbohydrate metabolism regulator)